VANAEQRRAQAESLRLAAEKDRELAAQAVITVTAEQTATRDKTVAVIGKQATAEQEKVERNMQTDIAAYQVTATAVAEQQAAEKRAAARTTIAAAEKAALVLEAEGQQATAMVPVQVSWAQAGVDRIQLEQKDQYGKVAVELQVRLKTIEAERDAKIAMAEALGEALSKADLKLWGDPSAVLRMTQSFYSGQEVGQVLDGVSASTPASVKDAVAGTLGSIGAIGAAFIKKNTGIDVAPAVVEAAVKQHLGAGDSGTQQ